jgi:predicted GNAT family acetyltransferase
VNIQHDPDSGRFFSALEHGEAELTYGWIDSSTIGINFVFVPPADRQDGVGERLVLHVLEWARGNELKVVPACSFARRVMSEHPEYDDLRPAEGH